MKNIELSGALIKLEEFGVQHAFYPNEEVASGVEYTQTEKGVKLFVISEKNPNKRINFWMPKVYLHTEDGVEYTHVKFYAVKILRSNVAQVLAEHKLKEEKKNASSAN